VKRPSGSPPAGASERLRRASLADLGPFALPWFPGSPVSRVGLRPLCWRASEAAGSCFPDQPPSWPAPCPAGCPAGVRCRRPDRYLLPRECRPEGRRQAPHPVAWLHLVYTVILSRFFRLCGACPRAGPADRCCPETVPVFRRRRPRAPGAEASVPGFPSSGRVLPGQGAVRGGPVVVSCRSRTRGSDPRSMAVRPVPVPPSPTSLCPKARRGRAAASRPKPFCCGVPRQPSAEAGAAVARLSGGERRSARPLPLRPGLTRSRRWVGRGLEGVTVFLPAGPQLIRPRAKVRACGSR